MTDPVHELFLIHNANPVITSRIVRHLMYFPIILLGNKLQLADFTCTVEP